MSALVPTHSIKINGVVYPLKFNFKTMLNFEREAKMKFFAFVNSLNPKKDETTGKLIPVELDVEKIVIMFQSFIVGAGKSITVDEAAELLDLEVMEAFMKLVPEMLVKGTPDKKDDDKTKSVVEKKDPLESKPQE